MILTSLQSRSARGRAAETAARPPTRTKSSISVVTNKTLKKRPAGRPHTRLCKNSSNYLGLEIQGRASGRRPYVTRNRFRGRAVQFRVRAAVDGPLGVFQ